MHTTTAVHAILNIFNGGVDRNKKEKDCLYTMKDLNKRREILMLFC